MTEAHYYPFGLALNGKWLTGGVEETKYRFNGIERNEDFNLNWDLADFRAYDPAIGRWNQIDPLAEYAPEWTSYRFGFNNPILYGDPFGLFESRQEAKDYAKEHGIRTGWFTNSRIRKGNDGTFSIVTKNWKSGVTTSTYHDPEIAELLEEQSNGDGTVTSVTVSPTDEIQTGNNNIFTIAGWASRDGSMSFPEHARPSIGLPAANATGSLTLLSNGSKLSTGVNASNTVYHSVKNGVTQYVGITNNLARRQAQHLASKGISIEPLLKGLSRSDARAVEQALIVIHKLNKNGGTLINKINSISPKRDIYKQQLQRGYELLKSIGYQ